MTQTDLPARHRHRGDPGHRVDRALRRALVITVILALGVLGYGTWAAMDSQPPIPDRVVTTTGDTVYTHDDIVTGKEVFQRADLMDFGSLYGNGAYFGPDWGTDYLKRASDIMRGLRAERDYGVPYAQLAAGQRTAVDTAVAEELRTNRYNDGTLVLTPDQVTAHETLRGYYTDLLTQGDKELGLQEDAVASRADAVRATDFFGWAAWTSITERPGEDYTYTNNWPYDEALDNTPTSSIWLWSWVSLGAVVVLGALIVWIYRRWIVAPHDALAEPSIPRHPPLTPSQASTAKWFLLVPTLMLAQGLGGSLMAHYYADRGSFFGIDIRSLLPFSVTHAWHLQLAIAWIAAAWLAAGIFLAPIVGRREPRGQRTLANLLWAAVVLVVVGSLAGIYYGVATGGGTGWFWFGNQGLEYIQLGRAFQIALFIGMVFWGVILLRAFWPTLRAGRRWSSLESLLLFSGVGIAIVYVFGMLPVNRPMASATMTDYWRWWVVHLWVEGMFEFFTVAVIGYAILAMGLLSRRLVERTVLFELILVFGSGILGTGHHFYWVGDPAVWLSLGAMFGMLEVIPLAFMLVRAWREYRVIHAAGRTFPQRVPFLFFTGAAVWNFVGAGVLGGVINPPIVNYFEHGQFMTLAHGHAAMLGTFGFLAIGLMYLALRGITSPDGWSDKNPIRAMWLLHAAIVLWLVLNIIPVGIGQFVATLDKGYWYARSVAFYDDWIFVQWLRMAGDVAFLAAAAIMLFDVVVKIRHRRRPTIPDGGTLEAPASVGEVSSTAS